MKITALYERLSNDDERLGESGSIQNQKSMLEAYAAQHGFSRIVHFTDDGYTGGNFDRPGWQAMIAEIEKGNVGTVIVKDMYRVGRNYLQTGFYTEVFFREHGVRFIAIANNIDSKDEDSGEFAPFLNIMSEYQLRNTSRSVKAAKKTQGMAGKRLTTSPIYGYMRDPQDKEKWIIDPDAAPVVKRIFALAIEGKGPQVIARLLSKEKVLRPIHHKRERGILKRNKGMHNYDPYVWSSTAVAHMISKPEYMGHTVNFRSSKDSYKDKNPREIPKEDWLIFENTHPAIIDPETWETAQKCRGTKRRINSLGEANPLTGLVFCADCGKKLYNHRQPESKTYFKKDGTPYTVKPSDVYFCSTYNKTGSRFEHKCTAHYVRTDVLRKLTLEAIQSVSHYVKAKETEFVQKVREDSVIRGAETEKAHKKRIAKEERRIAELDTLIRRIYEDNVNGKLTDKRFATLSQEYEREQTELEESIQQLKVELVDFQADNDRVDRFIDLVKRHTDFAELTPTMLAEFVEKIVVHERDKSSGERVQDVEIHLNFIGKFDVPISEPTLEGIEAEELARFKRERHREAQRKYLTKQKRKTA